jgi:hypothetical protein
MAVKDRLIDEPVPEGLANADLTTAEGQPYHLADAWKERSAVLVWVRHFG